jgi:hypothetical protein
LHLDYTLSRQFNQVIHFTHSAAAVGARIDVLSQERRTVDALATASTNLNRPRANLQARC